MTKPTVDLVSQPTAWERARHAARRRSLHRGWRVLAFLPIALAVWAVAIGAAWLPAAPDSPLGTNPGDPTWIAWAKKIVVIVGTLSLTALVGYEMLSDLWAAFRGDPLVLRGKVVKKEELQDVNSVVWIFRPLFGYDLVLDVERAVRIDRSGTASEDRTFLGTGREVPTSRGVHHRAQVDQRVFLVCTSTGRAIATLSDLLGTEAANELTGILDAEPAPDPES
jgi:hypothetical protein